MITTNIQNCGTSVLLSVDGYLDDDADAVLQRAFDCVTANDQTLMVDIHGVTSMDPPGLLHLLDLHRRAQCLGLRVMVVGWQPQPQQLMAEIAGIRGPGSATGERYALDGFRYLITRRAQQAQDSATTAAQTAEDHC